MYSKPSLRPKRPYFSSGPSVKRLGWSLPSLFSSIYGRSHRSLAVETRLLYAIGLTREILEIPSDYFVAIVPGSDTGAFEMSLWNFLGARSVDVVSWEYFGSCWLYDICKELNISPIQALTADYGKIADLEAINFNHDVVFVWNGTTSGVRVPNANFIPDDRDGLTICDATSAVFAQNVDFKKLDITTFSWQKVLGGEAAHGMIVLSPRAWERLETWQPSWPIPKLFRLTSKGKILKHLFEGKTINTPSMLCVEDYIDALHWAKKIGGLQTLIQRADENFSVLDAFVSQSPWLQHLAQDPLIRSNTSVCLSMMDPAIMDLSYSAQCSFLQDFCQRLEEEKVAYDISSHREAPLGLRIWCGPSVEKKDLETLMPWLDWSFFMGKDLLQKKKTCI